MSSSTGPDIITDGLVLHLDASDIKSYPGTGTTWFDRSGNGNHGTLINGPTFSSANGGSLLFDGTNDYINCGAVPQVGSSLTGLTVSVWFKVGTNQTEIIAENGTSYLANTFYIEQEGNNFSFIVANSSGHYQRIFGSTYTIGNWYNFVGVWSSGLSVLAYVNGQDTSQSLLSPFGNLSSVRSGDTNLFIASRAGTSLFSTGRVSNLFIYNRALSQLEIQQNFKASKSRFDIQ